MAERKLRVGVIGTGFGTIVHIPGYQSCPDTEVVAVCSAHKERAEEAAAKFDIPHAFTDYREMVQMPELDLISITTPPFEHCAMTMAALDAGKHVLCEKPMALNVRECKEMLAKAEEKGLVHMMVHEFRFAPQRSYVSKLIADGYIGKLRHVNVSLYTGARGGSLANPVYSWAAQRSMGGGMLMALGSHYIDALRYWFGDYAGVFGQVFTHIPERSDPADRSKAIHTDADDAFAFQATFKDGGWATMTASMAAPFGPGARIEIYGAEGTLVAPQRGFNPEPDGKIYGARIGEKELRDIPVPSALRPFEDHRDDRLLPFRLQLDLLVKAIREKKPVAPTFYDGLKVQEVLDGILQSNDTGKWVEIL